MTIRQLLKVNQLMVEGCFWSIAIILCVTYSSVDGRRFDVGLCDDKIYDCSCGQPPNDHIFQLKFKRCSSFYRWELQCDICSGHDPEKKCAQYKFCQECRDDDSGCVSCPTGKFGQWCNGDCKCQNGGTCNRNDGSCACPPSYAGVACEKRILCDPPEEISGLTWDGDSRKVGDVVLARCKSGSSLIGPKTRTCTESGSWMPEAPICEPMCLFPNLGPHLKSQINPGMANKTFDTDNKEIIKEIQFRCDPGYTLVGPHRLQCQSSGTWDQEPPKCQVMKVCKDPGTPSKGNRIVVDAIDGAFVPGTAIKFQCNKGHFLSGPAIITCISSGNWSDSVPQCPQVSGCPPPDVPGNGNVEITKPVPNLQPEGNASLRPVSRIALPTVSSAPNSVQNIPPGYSSAEAKALYSCKSIYYRLEGPKTRICLPNGVWSGKQPVCKALCGQSYENKRPAIVNGVTSVLGKWPWQVAMFSPNIDLNNPATWMLRCGGSLINENWVVTAAHCVTETRISKVLDVKLFRLYLGKYFIDTSMDDSEVKVFSVKKIIVHPNYHPRSMDSDIALMELTDSVTFTTRIQPVCLPHVSDLTPVSALESNLPDGTGIATGWGITETGKPATVLQETKLGIVNRSFCEEEYRLQSIPISVTANMFCAGWEKGGTGTCKGDSGGPFVVEETTEESTPGLIRKRWVVQGIISWIGSLECGAARQFAGLLNVANFVPWIEQFV